MLPEGVGVPVGGETKYQYLVLQLHYLNVDLLPSEGDTAGVDLHYTEKEPEKSAGTVSVHVTTNLPPLSRKAIEEDSDRNHRNNVNKRKIFR